MLDHSANLSLVHRHGGLIILGGHLALISNARKQELGRAEAKSILVIVEGKLDIAFSVGSHELYSFTSEL